MKGILSFNGNTETALEGRNFRRQKAEPPASKERGSAEKFRYIALFSFCLQLIGTPSLSLSLSVLKGYAY